MNIRFFITLSVILFTLGCKAETKNAAIEQARSTPTNSIIIESAISSFSMAVTKKDVGVFLSIADPSGIYLVRLFTSGNLGGRGPSLSEKINPIKIDKELAFSIKEQTPMDLPRLFPSLPIKSFKALPGRTLLPEIETAHYDQWAAALKKSLANAPEVVEGDPIILSSNGSKYWVYAEAQIIDELLVGGFAVFSMQNGKLSLVALIELL